MSPLVILFSKVLDEQAVPRDWKEANVVPIFKGGQRNAASNYRPVSLTSQTTRWAFSWTSPLSPRPYWLDCLPVRLHKVNHKVNHVQASVRSLTCTLTSLQFDRVSSPPEIIRLRLVCLGTGMLESAK